MRRFVEETEGTREETEDVKWVRGRFQPQAHDPSSLNAKGQRWLEEVVEVFHGSDGSARGAAVRAAVRAGLRVLRLRTRLCGVQASAGGGGGVNLQGHSSGF